MQRKVIFSKLTRVALVFSIIAISFVMWAQTAKTSTASSNNLDGALVAQTLESHQINSARNEAGVNKEALATQLGAAINANKYPDQYDFTFNGSAKHAHISYTLDEVAQKNMEKLLAQYAPDYGAFVAMDAKTGRILAMVSESRHTDTDNLTLRATFPSASIFKVVTASAAIDTNKAASGTDRSFLTEPIILSTERTFRILVSIAGRSILRCAKRLRDR